MARQQPEQQPPPVQRLRVQYAKRGRMRFTSHRDFSRAFERAIVRAGLPMAYSSGFNPHPRISYAGAAPTGSASEAEYLEIGLAQAVDPQTARLSLDQAMPEGLDVIRVEPAGPGGLSDHLQASRWSVRFPYSEYRADLAELVQRFLDAPEVVVSRMTKRGLREFDCRAAVLSLQIEADSATGQHLLMVVRHAEPAVRPDDVLRGLARTEPGLEPGAESSIAALDGALFTRLEQGPWDEATATIGDPLSSAR